MREFSSLSLSTPFMHFNTQTDQPAFWLLSQYLLNEFQLAQMHETGMACDRDTEYLHQYRVSLRRCRSLLAILQDCYRSRSVDLLLQQFKALMEPTGKLRDLDVFLDPKSHDPIRFEMLNPLRPQVQLERNQAFEWFSVWLKSNEYRALKQATFTSLIECAQHPTHLGLEDVHAVTTEKWTQHQKKLRKSMGNIHADSADDDIHTVRIACKKMRYLTDFAFALHIELKPNLPLKKLKQLQTELGAFNDSACQIVFCRDHLAPLQCDGETAEAIQSFIDHTMASHQHNKQRIIRLLNRLSG
ncbi:CHAD domain-containing protein [Vibrio furnissii]|uniref:CHAD domain-containing protein n=1 Tax=Vibrio furnissii TaxID=29494 RepID=UPI0001B92874|nr:CHAD domain-containing protein [Vibrio furnissii]EEX40683.1 CHAD domain protein [Vibrio furnissii CIP 102972]QDC95354.1 CHAD domain-containing protein [Vibrio furnissii]UON50786.1 CHAD domain-containing protein [Vibrio furnissii]SUQ33085.1 CHAD domain protein [Vibrio furnissii]